MSSTIFHFGPKKSWPFPGVTAGGEHLFGASPNTLNNIVNINNTSTNPKWFATMPQMKYTINLLFTAMYGAKGYTTFTFYPNNTVNFSGNGYPIVKRMDDTFSSQIGTTWSPYGGTFNLGNITQLNPAGYTPLAFRNNTVLEYFMLYQNGYPNLNVFYAWTMGLFISPNPNNWNSYVIATNINSNTVTVDSTTIHMQSYIKQSGATCTVLLKYSIYQF